MTRLVSYKPLCWQCVFGFSKHPFCNIKRDCSNCSNVDKDRICNCVKEKPEHEKTCPYFKYLYLRG